MIILDTIKFLVQREHISEILSINDFDLIKSQLKITYRQDSSNEHIRICHQLIVDKVGFANVIFSDEDYTLRFFEIELSAKVLGGDYFVGISRLNFSVVLDTIERELLQNGYHLNRLNFLKYSSLGRFDVSECLLVKHPVQEYINQIKQHFNSSQYRLEPYRSGGIAINKFVQTKRAKERLIIYDKIKDIKRCKEYELISNYLTDYLEHLHVLRIEQNFTSYAKMRQLLGIDKINIVEVLNSNRYPNWKLLSKIVNFDEKKIKKNIQPSIKVRYLAFEQLLNHFNNDAKKVENELKEMYKSNYYHYKKQFQEFRREDLYEINSILLEVQEKIST